MTGEGEQTLRKRRAAATILTIERNAVQLVLEHGLENVTVEMICEKSGVSPRTFFNYFGTKDTAILGLESPHIDERRAREFIASDGKNILAEALQLIAFSATELADPQLGALRMLVTMQHPSLFHKQMERFSAIEAEMAEILYFRLRRTAGPSETPDETREQSSLATHLLAGIFRYTASKFVEGTPHSTDDQLAHTTALLTTLLPRLTGR